MNKYFKVKKKNNLVGCLLYLVLVGFICAFLFIYYFSKNLGDGLIKCAEDEMERLIILVLNNGVKKYLTNSDMKDLLEIRYNDGDINLIRYNTKVINQVMMDITDILESDIDYLVRGDIDKIELGVKNISSDYYDKINDGIIYGVSMGSATGNQLLANLGPKIPLRLSVIGSVMTSIKSDIKDYGLNNAMINVYVEIEVECVIQMPFMSKNIRVKDRVPLTMEVIQGSIPSYYYGSNSVLK